MSLFPINSMGEGMIRFPIKLVGDGAITKIGDENIQNGKRGFILDIHNKFYMGWMFCFLPSEKE
jgi:hypothetical protein